MKNLKILSLLAVSIFTVVIKAENIETTHDASMSHKVIFGTEVESLAIPKNMIRVGIFLEASPETLQEILNKLFNNSASAQYKMLEDADEDVDFNELKEALNKQ